MYCPCAWSRDLLNGLRSCLKLALLHDRPNGSDSKAKLDLFGMVFRLYSTLAYFKMVQKEVCILCTYSRNSQLGTHRQIHNTAPWIFQWRWNYEVRILFNARHSLLSLRVYIYKCLSVTIGSFHRRCDIRILHGCHTVSVAFMARAQPNWLERSCSRDNIPMYCWKHIQCFHLLS